MPSMSLGVRYFKHCLRCAVDSNELGFQSAMKLTEYFGLETNSQPKIKIHKVPSAGPSAVHQLRLIKI